MGGRLVGDFTDDLDDDVLVRSLRVDIGDTDLAVLKVERLDAVVDGLCGWKYRSAMVNGMRR